MRLIIDAMGGDHAPKEIVLGALQAAEEYETEIVLVGRGEDVLNAMRADSGIALASLKVDGGASANNYLMQTMADISNLPVERPCCVETTALGAAYLAGLAVGYWSSTDEVVKNWSVDRTFLPQITAEERAKRIKGWNKAVRCSYHWALDEEES